VRSTDRYMGTIADIVAKERPIGFYHSGPRLRSSDLEITELFKRFCPRPVMVIVDTRAHGGRGDTGIPTDAYFPVEEIRDVGHGSAERP
jgi:26S proteasome regulatory subunit N8